MPPARFRDELVAEMMNLRAFAISLGGSASVADDLVQEAMLRAWSNFDRFQPGTSMRAWLFTILRNIHFSNRRKRPREVQDSDGLYAERIVVPAGQVGHIELQDFRKALALLPPEQREALILVGASGLSYQEAAGVCEVEVGTIKSRVSRARSRLADLLGLDPPTESSVRPSLRQAGKARATRECRNKSSSIARDARLRLGPPKAQFMLGPKDVAVEPVDPLPPT